jgi:PAS domain S-box-containing protein
MNLIFISDDPREADPLKYELAAQAPAIHLEAFLNTKDAMARMSASAACDALLLDASVPILDAFNLVTAIRQSKKAIGIVSLVSTAEKKPPVDLLKAGVDSFVLKRAGFVPLLQDALNQAKARHQTNPYALSRKVRLLYAGDIQTIQKNASSLPQIAIESVLVAPDGMLKLPQTGTLQDEVLVIDCAATGTSTLNAIKDVNLRIPHIPIILLINPGDEETAIQAMRAGASDCVAKTASCFQRLLPVIERENKRRELVRMRTALKSREERLRQIVETMPVGITVVAPDGTFLAINRVGLKLMGAERLEQIIGKNFNNLLPQEEREKVAGLFAAIGKGNSASIRICWKGLDGTIPGIELRAVPMRRDSAGTTAALAAVYPLSETGSGPLVEEEAQQKHRDLEKALQDSESRFVALQNKYILQESKWEEVLQQVESRCIQAEEQQALLKAAEQEAEARYTKLLEEQTAERAGWEQTREGLKEQCVKIESMAESLRSTQQNLLESHSAERMHWESMIPELERKQHDSETQLAQLLERLSVERSQWDAARLELEQKAQYAQSLQASLESALGDAETRLAHQGEGFAAEKSQWESVRQDLERKIEDAEIVRATLQDALRNAEDNLARQTDERNSERSQCDALRLELEQKAQAIESQRSALESTLRDAEAHFERQVEAMTVERSNWNAIRLDLEQKNTETEAQRTSLQIALEEVESYLSHQTEEHVSERSLWNLARLELEQKCLYHEEQQAALQNALRQAEATLANAIEEHNSEHAQWQAVCLELEQKCQIFERQQTELKSALQEAESRSSQIAEENRSKSEFLDAKIQQIEQLQADMQQLATELAGLQLRNQELSQYSTVGMVLATLEGRVLRCNDAAAHMFGFAGAEEVQSGEYAFHLYAFEGALKDRLQESGKLENVEWASLTRDGRLIRIQENARLLAASAGKPPCVERILTDISRTHPLSAEIRRARRMQATTDLAIATIKSLQDLCVSLTHCGAQLKESAKDEKKACKVADTLLNDANRGIKHARQFFSIAQKSDRTQELLDLNKVLADNDVMLRNLAGEDIDLQTALATGIGLVSANSQELAQLISSLMTSSREILPMGGTVNIETSNVEIVPSTSDLSPEMRPGTYVLLIVTADGCSVRPERRIGSIQTMVQRIGGWLVTTGNSQSGNICKIYLPRVEVFAPTSPDLK